MADKKLIGSIMVEKGKLVLLILMLTTLSYLIYTIIASALKMEYFSFAELIISLFGVKFNPSLVHFFNMMIAITLMSLIGAIYVTVSEVFATSFKVELEEGEEKTVMRINAKRISKTVALDESYTKKKRRIFQNSEEIIFYLVVLAVGTVITLILWFSGVRV